MLFIAGLAVAGMVGLSLVAITQQAERRRKRVLALLGTPITTGLDGAARPERSGGRNEASASEEVTLEGVLEQDNAGDDALVSSFHAKGIALMEEANHYARSMARPLIHIRTSRDVVELDGPIQVVLGSEERAVSSDDVAEGLRGRTPNERGVLRTVRAGDRVRVRGRVQSVARLATDTSEAAAGYRASATAYRLVPEEDPEWPRRPIPLVAIHSRGAGYSLQHAAFLAIAAGGLTALGVSLYEARTPRITSPLPGPVPTAAVALPRPACAVEIDRLLAASDPWTAKTKLGACDDAQASARTSWVLGDFAGASTAWLEARRVDPGLELTVSEVEAHALAGRHDLAVQVIDRMSAAWYPGPPNAEKTFLGCAADAIRAADGEPGALMQLKTHQFPSSQCGLLFVAHDPNREQYAGGTDSHRPHWEERVMLAANVERSLPRGDVENGTFDAISALRDPRSALHMMPVAWARAIADKWRTPHPTPDSRGSGRYFNERTRPLSVAGFAAEAALFFAFVGDDEKARLYGRQVDGLTQSAKIVHVEWGAPDYDAEREVLGLRDTAVTVAGAAAAHVGDLELARKRMLLIEEHGHAMGRLDEWLRLVQGRRPPNFDGFDSGFDPDHALFTAAEKSSFDANEMVRVLEEKHWSGHQALSRALPFVQDRAPLKQWVRERFPAPCVGCGLWALLENLAERKSAARLLDEPELVRRIDAGLTPVANAVSTPSEVLVPLLFLEEFRETGKL